MDKEFLIGYPNQFFWGKGLIEIDTQLSREKTVKLFSRDSCVKRYIRVTVNFLFCDKNQLSVRPCS